MPLGVGMWRDQLATVVGGRPVILTCASVAAATELVDHVRRLGAAGVMVIAVGGPGAGPPPSPGTARILELGEPAGSMFELLARGRARLAVPTPELQAEVDAFDPERTAVAIGDQFNQLPSVCGRPYLAHRAPEWVELEDKVVVDGFWDRAGVTRAPAAVVALARPELRDALARLDQGDGVVVSADASAGWHGGAEYVRRVTSAGQIDDVVAAFADRARSVRVMPYLVGVPCSIHGIVIDDDVVVVRPVELLVFGRPDGRFWYAGCATFFDPPAEDRVAMRAVAAATGRQLRAEVGFRGAFTVDGVLTAAGFLPTELNPRSGAGLRPLTQALDLPVPLLLDTIVAGRPLDWRARDLERLLVSSADEHRAGSTYREFEQSLGPDHGELVLADGEFRTPAVGESADLRYEVAARPAGSTVRGFPVVDRVPVGPSVAPVVAAFWRWADRELGLGIGPLIVPAATRS